MIIKTIETLIPPKNMGEFPVLFKITDSLPALVGIQIKDDDPSTLWVSKKVGRLVWRDLVDQGYAILPLENQYV